MSKVGFWLKGSTGKLAGTTLYKGANGETIQREVVSPSNPKTQAQNIQRIVMSTVGAAYSVMKAICDHSFEGGGSSSGGDTPAVQNYAISAATVNNQSITVGSAKQVMCAEGEDTEDLNIRVTFSTVGNATAVLLFKGDEQIGTEHAISGSSVNFTAAGAAIGTYTIKVKKSDNSLVTTGYTINVVAYSAGGGYDPDDDAGQD